MRKGKSSFELDKPVYIEETFSLAGKNEADGNFRGFFDLIFEKDDWSCKTFEKTEIKMQKFVIEGCLKKVNLLPKELDMITGGDLINQIVPTNFAVRDYALPFLGLYNACATFGEALIVGSMSIQMGMDKIICITSSHFATAERQFRFPSYLGTIPTPTSQWTVSGSGCALITSQSEKNVPKIMRYTIGKVVDLQCTDANNMGAAMAPAACDSIVRHFQEFELPEDYYDMVITGDLGRFGMDTLSYLLKNEGLNLDKYLNDTGAMIFKKNQKTCQGGSGAGCSSLVFASYLYKNMLDGNLKKILFVPTGALLSQSSPLQGETIPSIAHAVGIEM